MYDIPDDPSQSIKHCEHSFYFSLSSSSVTSWCLRLCFSSKGWLCKQRHGRVQFQECVEPPTPSPAWRHHLLSWENGKVNDISGCCTSSLLHLHVTYLVSGSRPPFNLCKAHQVSPLKWLLHKVRGGRLDMSWSYYVL